MVECKAAHIWRKFWTDRGDYKGKPKPEIEYEEPK